MSVIAAQWPRGHVALMALEDVLCTATERKKVRKRERGRVGGKGRLPGCLQLAFFFFLSFFTESPLLSLFSSFLFLYSPPPPTSSFTPIFFSPILFSSILSSSLGRFSWVSLEGKCNNAPTRWNRARSIISREMDGPCRAGGGHARTQFRFNKLAKQDPQSDLSLTRCQCLLLRC